MEPEQPVLKVTKLEKSFKVGNQLISVIKGMDFEIYRGDFAIIIGPSGSGKSTLLHMLLGLEVPTSGSVICLGNDLYTLPNEDARASFRKKHVGMVYQQPNWIKSLNVVENVAFPLSLLGVDKGEAIKQAWHVILKMNMSNWVNYYPTELSGGQQQKIALARALVTDPEIIIADEPTGNLDFDSGQNLMNLLKELNDSGKTVLMVTHDLEYVKFAKSVIKIFDGKVASFVDRSVYDVASKENTVVATSSEVTSLEAPAMPRGKRNPAGLDIFIGDKADSYTNLGTSLTQRVFSDASNIKEKAHENKGTLNRAIKGQEIESKEAVTAKNTAKAEPVFMSTPVISSNTKDVGNASKEATILKTKSPLPATKTKSSQSSTKLKAKPKKSTPKKTQQKKPVSTKLIKSTKELKNALDLKKGSKKPVKKFVTKKK